MQNEHPTLRQIYLQLSEEQLKEADHNIQQYLALVLRVHARLEQDPVAMAEFLDLTKRRDSRRVTQRSTEKHN